MKFSFKTPLCQLGDPTEDFAFMTVEDFKDAVDNTMFTDYDGFGYLIKDGFVCIEVEFVPSMIEDIPREATHVAWYNK